MRTESYDFLKSIEETPSVSGYEQPVARIIRKRMAKFVDTITTDVHGNVIACLNPKGGPRVMLAGHMDQIGFLVKYIGDSGYIHLAAVGGIDNSVLPGKKVTIHSKKGPITGVIGRKAIHLMKAEERNAGKIELPDVAVDIGAKDKAQALEFISVGDPVTYELGLQKVLNDRIVSPALDNKVGAFVVMEALRLCARGEAAGKCSVCCVSTVQEEIGLRGATDQRSSRSIRLVGIAVDVCARHRLRRATTDKQIAGEVQTSAKGPVLFEVGPNINPRRLRSENGGDGQATKKIDRAGARRAARRDWNRRQRHASYRASRRGDGADRHPQPLHAHARRALQPGRPRKRRHPDRRDGEADRREDELYSDVKKEE